MTRQRCWKFDWVVEFDIKGLFDNLDHDLLMRAVKHTNCKWSILYIKRWLKAPLQLPGGRLQERTCGVPQGGVISPVLSNLFLHYVFDVWMARNFSDIPWCRYADDGLVHCKTEKQAKYILACLRKRFADCSLKLHLDKTKIVYCRDGKRRLNYPITKFDFLGYGFQCRKVRKRGTQEMFLSFTPSASNAAQKEMKDKVRKMSLRNRSNLSLEDIARKFNPIIRGWINYYGKYSPGNGMKSVLRHFNQTLVRWTRHKFKTLKGKKRAIDFLIEISQAQPSLFPHWKLVFGQQFV